VLAALCAFQPDWECALAIRLAKSVAVFLLGLAIVAFIAYFFELGAWSGSVLWRKVAVTLLFWLPFVVAGLYFAQTSGFGKRGTDE